MVSEFKSGGQRHCLKCHGTTGRKRWIQRAKGDFVYCKQAVLRRAEMKAIRTKNGAKKVGIFTPTPL
jgi:hypothetical protein